MRKKKHLRSILAADTTADRDNLSDPKEAAEWVLRDCGSDFTEGQTHSMRTFLKHFLFLVVK